MLCRSKYAMWINRITVAVLCSPREARNTGLPTFFHPSFPFLFFSSLFLLFLFYFPNWKVRISKAKIFMIEPGPGAAQYTIFMQNITIFTKIPKGLMKELSKRSCLKSFPVVTPLVDDHHLPSLLTVSISVWQYCS